ncbi:MAG: L,D-transpeptidase [Actinomycetota bacterium]
MAAVAVLFAFGCGGGGDPLTGRAPAGPTVAVELDARPTHSIVATALAGEITARADPSPGAEPVAVLRHPTERGAPLVFQVLRIEGDRAEVLLPVRPNGTSGWVRLDQVALAENPYRIEIVTGDHVLRLWREGRLELEAPVAIGTGATPTPIGDFYLTELVRPPDPAGPYGTHAYGLSGYSETLSEFNGGDGVIGLHGTNDPSSLGGDVSHGCVRLANDTIDRLAAVLPLGTPVVISA